MIVPFARFVVRFVAVAVAAGVVFAAAAPATAQDRGTFSNRLDRLERDIQTLNRMMAGKPPLPGDAAALSTTSTEDDAARQSLARIDVRITGLENDLRAATGRVEDVNFQLTQIQRRLDKLVADVDFRLSALEKGRAATAAPATADSPSAAEAPMPAMPGDLPQPAPGSGTLGTLSGQDLARANVQAPAPAASTTAPAALPAQTPFATAAPVAPPVPPRAAPNPPAITAAAPSASAAPNPGVLPEGSVKDQYTYAFGFLRQNKFEEAEAALKAFVAAHPKDELAGNARYWLGETYYVRREYVKAAEMFLEGYQNSPTGNKAPDTLLKLGMSLSNLDKKREACATLAKLSKDFPDAPNSILTLAGREREKNGCK